MLSTEPTISRIVRQDDYATDAAAGPAEHRPRMEPIPTRFGHHADNGRQPALAEAGAPDYSPLNQLKPRFSQYPLG